MADVSPWQEGDAAQNSQAAVLRDSLCNLVHVHAAYVAQRFDVVDVPTDDLDTQARETGQPTLLEVGDRTLLGERLALARGGGLLEGVYARGLDTRMAEPARAVRCMAGVLGLRSR